MRYFLSMVLFIVLATLFQFPSYANYRQYERVDILGGKSILDYSEEELRPYYPEVLKKKFMGWRVNTIQSRLPVTYIKQTLFSYYNDGFTPIKYTYVATYQSSQTFQINATGSVGIDMKDDAKSYKNKLDAAIKISADYKSTVEEKTTIDIKIDVDPKTQVNIYIYGEGYLTSGVAARYFVWLRVNIGGYEFFESTTEYQRLEKIRI